MGQKGAGLLVWGEEGSKGVAVPVLDCSLPDWESLGGEQVGCSLLAGADKVSCF